MPMNEQPPWGQKKKPSTPEDFLAILIQKIRDSFAGQEEQGNRGGDSGNEPPPPMNFLASIGKAGLLALGALVVFGIYSSAYTIETKEVGVILQFGKYNRTTDPGLHLKIPYVETLAKVDVQTIRKEEFGFRTTRPGKNTVFDRGYDKESLMLTGDKNVINVAWIVQYRVSDPFKFTFNVRNVPQAVRDFSEMVTRRIVGNMDFDYVLGNREQLAAMAKEELQAVLNGIDCGVSVLTLQLLDINPPDPVKPAFNEVNEADQDMKRLVNEAEEYYNKIIPKAKGNAKKIVEEAKGYAVQRVNEAQGETNRFLSIVAEYSQAEDVTRQRMYLEAMRDILPNVENVYVMNREQQTILPFLDLTRRSGEQAANSGEQAAK